MYDVQDLVKLCNERILEAVTPLTVCKTYEAVKNLALEYLLDHCKNLMVQFAFLIFWKDFHLVLDEATMSFLLASDRLCLLDEEEALGALWRWGCTRRVLEKNLDTSTEKRIAKLLPLIRDSFVEGVQVVSPWYGVWETIKSDAGRKTNTEKRKVEEMPKMIRFAEVFCVTKEIDSEEQLSSARKENLLLKFSLNRDILLAGFSVHVRLTIDNPGLLCFSLNDKAITTHYHVIQVRQERSSSRTHGESYLYDLIIELKTPVLLRKSEFSHLTAKIKDGHSTFAHITTYAISRRFVQHVTGLELSYSSDRAAVKKMYHFV